MRELCQESEEGEGQEMIVRKILFIAAAGATAITSACGGGGSGPPPPSALVPSEYDQVAPAISGSTVAWEDYRNSATAGTDIFTYDTGTLAESLVAGGSGDQTDPAVSDSFFAWIDGGRLRAKNRSTGQVTNVTTGGITA